MPKSPEEWLNEVDPARRPAVFKLFLGYAPGVGKTYAMLSEGVRRASRGEEVVIGVVESHGRKPILELSSRLETVPRKKLEYKSTIFEEMDVDAILERKPHPEMGYRACLGILSLEKVYSQSRLEAASQRAVQLQAFSYHSLKSILKRSLDRQLLLDSEAVAPGPRHENLRGPLYYDPPTKLVQ